MDTYFIDGEFVSEDKCFISAKDLAVLRGFGAFDFLITYNRRPFHLKEHVRRLENSAREIGLALPHPNSEICRIVEETVARNPHHNESSIRIVYTGGISADGITPQGNGKLMVMVTPRQILPDGWYTDGAKVITSAMERFVPNAKSTNYLSAVYAMQRAHGRGAIESIYVDRHNRILEGTTTNFYFFKGDRLVTPGENILPGVTRSVVLDLAKAHFQVEIRDIDKGEIETMKEVFITASNKEIVPIVRIDDTVIGPGRPGEKTRRIMQLFKDYTTAWGQGTYAEKPFPPQK